MSTIIYKGYMCNIIKSYDGGFYDLRTIYTTEKGIIEEFLSVHRSELIEEGNNL